MNANGNKRLITRQEWIAAWHFVRLPIGSPVSSPIGFTIADDLAEDCLAARDAKETLEVRSHK